MPQDVLLKGTGLPVHFRRWLRQLHPALDLSLCAVTPAWIKGEEPGSCQPQSGRQCAGPPAVAMVRLEAWISEATGLGAIAAQPPRQEPFGAEARLLDPEGNRLLLLVASAHP